MAGDRDGRGRDSRVELEELRRAKPPAPERVNLGFGKVLVPPRVPPLPRVAPTREPTRTDIGMLGPSPGSVAPKRSISPPPVDLAPDPQSARVARREARERVAEAEREDKSTLDSIVEIPGVRRGLSAAWRWALPLLLGAVTTVGGWVYGYAKGLAAAYERVAAIEQRAKGMGERVARIEAAVEELTNAHAAEARSNRAERATATKRHEELVDKLEKAVPKIHGLPTKPPP